MLRRFLAGSVALGLALALSACQSAQDQAPNSAFVDSLSDLTLSASTNLPTDLSALGPAQAWKLPSGWTVSPTGARRDGDRLIMNVDDSSAPTPQSTLFGGASAAKSAQTWVLNTKTGTVHRYAPVTDGWGETATIAAGGWMLRREEPSDGGSWRLYAQPLDSPNPRLLAQSSQTTSPGDSPAMVTDGRKIAWEQGDASGRYTIKLWTPGAKTPVTVAERSGQGLLDFTQDGRLFVGEAVPGSKRAHTVTQLPLPGQKTSAATTTYMGLFPYSVTGKSVVYFPGRGDGHGQWTTMALGGDATSKGEPISPGVDGPYTAEWINPSILLSYSATGLTIFDLDHPTSTATSSSTRIRAPRVDQDYLTIGYNPPKGAASMVISRHYD